MTGTIHPVWDDEWRGQTHKPKKHVLLGAISMIFMEITQILGYLGIRNEIKTLSGLSN